MHVIYDPDGEAWQDCLSISTSTIQYGNGATDWTFFQGLPYQRGAGLGDVFRSLYRFLLPLGKAAVGAMGDEGMKTTHRVLSQVLSGQDAKTALRKEAKTGVRNLLYKAADAIPEQEGDGRRKRRLTKKPPTLALGPPQLHKALRARRRKDIFGEY